MPDLETLERPAVLPTRLYVGDLTTHGPWVMARLIKAYPNQNERSVIGWLNGIMDDNTFICLKMPKAVAIAERRSTDLLAQKLTVREVLVWCEDPTDAEQIRQAKAFYPLIADWGRHQGIDKMIVGERSDVPHADLKELFPRLNDLKTYFVRI